MASRESLYLDFKRNMVESEMLSDKKNRVAKAFNWVAFGFALAILALSLFILFSITISMLVVTKPGTNAMKASFDYIINQFKVTKWMYVAFMASFGCFFIISVVLYFVILRKAPSKKLIIWMTIPSGIGLLATIGSLFLLMLGHDRLANSYFRYDNIPEKIYICLGCIGMIIGSCCILVPNIMFLSGHKKYSTYDSVCSGYCGLTIAAKVFAAIDIGFAGFAWICVFLAGTNKGGWSVFIQYLWMLSYFMEIILLLCVIISMMLQCIFIRKNQLLIKMCISNGVIYCAFILSYYFICTQCYNNTQLEGTFDLLGVFKLFVPSIYYLVTNPFRGANFSWNFK